MPSKAPNLLLDLCREHLLLCSAISTVHLHEIQLVFYSSITTEGMIKNKDDINTGMKILKDLGAFIKLYNHLAIGPLYIGTFTIFKILEEITSPHGYGFLVIMYQGGSFCVRINIFRVDSMIFINGLEIWNYILGTQRPSIKTESPVL